MIRLPNLWDRLTIDPSKLATIAKDWSEGKVPDLPYVIIGQESAKSAIAAKISMIDGDRMVNSIIQANYGDGKTNIIKYLKLYFDLHPELNVKMLYCRANPDQTDLCLFLMQHIQFALLDEIENEITRLKEADDYDYKALVSNFDDDFAAIKEYTAKLFDASTDAEALRELLYMGTGRLYSKGVFSKYGLQQLTDFNRREVLVLFLNILASARIYVLFAIDELEKIRDKSLKRMAHFFTSYRELIDLFSKIRGHYLISCITKGVEINLLSPPFYSRVEPDIVTLQPLTSKEDITKLVELMAELNKIEVFNINDVVSRLLRKKKVIDSNRALLQEISAILMRNKKSHTDFLVSLDQDAELSILFNETRDKIKADGGFENLSRAFFDPLEYYLLSKGYNTKDNIYRRDYQAFYDSVANRVFFFLFNDKSKLLDRISHFVDDEGCENFVAFAPKDLDLTNAELSALNVGVRIIEYDPEELFVLLNMYRWNFDKQDKISDFISMLTESVFD